VLKESNALSAEHLEQLMFISQEAPRIPHPRDVGTVAVQTSNTYDSFVSEVHKQFMFYPHHL